MSPTDELRYDDVHRPKVNYTLGDLVILTFLGSLCIGMLLTGVGVCSLVALKLAEWAL